MDINDLSPYIRVAMDSVVKYSWHLKERVIFDYELLYIKEGEVLVTIEEEKLEGRPGDIFLFKPKQRHSIQIIGKKNLRQPHIHFDLFYQPDSPNVKVSFKPLEQMTDSEMELFREDAADILKVDFPTKISLQKVDYFEKMLFDIINEFQMKLPFYEVSMKGLFIKLWTYLLREFYWRSNPAVFSSIEDLSRIKDYLSYHINRNITLDELACEFSISKYHLTRLFKKAFAMTPIHYHQLMRIEKSKQMIQFTDKNFTTIAEIFGFSSINAFSRTFKNVEGVPPSFYRGKGG